MSPFLQISFNNLYSFHVAFLKVINTLDNNNIELNMSFHVEAVHKITDAGTLSWIWPGIITNLSSPEFVLVTHSAHYENNLPRTKVACIVFPALRELTETRQQDQIIMQLGSLLHIEGPILFSVCIRLKEKDTKCAF